MNGLKVTAELDSPLIIGASAHMTLDGILGAVLFDDLQDIEAAHAAIPIKQVNGLFHASAMFVDTLNETKVSFIAGLHAQHSIDPDLILKKKDGALHRAFDSKLTNVMNTYRSITASDATWYVVGDASRIQALLNRVHFIGKRRASGYGRVLSWHCEIFDTNGLTSYGDPLRPIPVDMFDGDRSLPVVDAAWRPAYWDMRNRAACYAPTLLGQ